MITDATRPFAVWQKAALDSPDASHKIRGQASGESKPRPDPARQHIATKPTLNEGGRLLPQSTHQDPQTLKPRTPCALPTNNHQADTEG
jgi:hypothetical protein